MRTERFLRVIGPLRRGGAGAALLCLACTANASALVRTVDFDALPASGPSGPTVVTDQYRASHGVHWVDAPGAWPPVVRVSDQAPSGDQVASLRDGCGSCEFVDPATTGRFTQPVSAVSVKAGWLGPRMGTLPAAVLTLQALNADGNVVASSPPTEVVRGRAFAGLEARSGQADITAFTLQARKGTDTDKDLAFDDLSFELPDAPGSPPPPDPDPPAAPPPAPAQQPPAPPATAAQEPVARFTWRMPERYAQGWSVYNPRIGAYPVSYVRPTTWSVVIDTCASDPGGPAPVSANTVRIEAAGYTGVRSSGDCQVRFDDLPRLGAYRVTVVVQAGGGTSPPARDTVLLRDHLIVSVGDSMASGEGAPDTEGAYAFPSNPVSGGVAYLKKILTGKFTIKELAPVHWQDKRCHRSARSGHALTAEALERADPHSSVTYVALACSGATIANLDKRRYAGQQPETFARPFPPQLDALATLTGVGTPGRSRHPAVVLMSIGINDLGFSSIVRKCATNLTKAHAGNSDCVYGVKQIRRLTNGTLRARYHRLAMALRKHAPGAEVYITDYPGDPFDSRDACGLLDLPNVGISSLETQAIAAVGRRFAEEIRRATGRNRWNYARGMTGRFKNRGYCRLGGRYLTKLEESLGAQGTPDGAVHPNRAGYKTMAGLLRKAIVLDPNPRRWRATLTIEAVCVGRGGGKNRCPRRKSESARAAVVRKPGGGGNRPGSGDDTRAGGGARGDGRTVRFRVPAATEAGYQQKSVRVRTFNRWTTLRGRRLVFHRDLYAAPRPSRFLRTLGVTANSILGDTHTVRDNFGAGRHTLRHPTGRLAFSYRVNVRRIDTGKDGAP